MFHVTSMRLAALVARIRDYRLAHDQHAAAINGWQSRRVAAGTWRYRDPRFDRQATRSPVQAGDRHG